MVPSNREIQALLADRMRHNGVGVVVGIIEPTGRRSVAYGRSGAANHRPLDGDTVFQIGSVSKVFVGLVLADMVLRGEVKLDDPAARYLPKGVGMPQRGRPITLADLSTHLSGLPPMPTNFDLRAQPDPIEAYSIGDLYQFLNSYRLPREPGTAEYSNLGVSLLGRLLGTRAGMEYADLLQSRVLTALGMQSTSFTLDADQQSRLAPGHDRDLEPVHTPEMKTLYPSGSLRSTVNDLFELLAANLEYRPTSLTQAMLYQRIAVRAPTSEAPRGNGWTEQALGWRVRKYGDHEVFGHEGGKQGYRCAVVMDPKARVGVVVLANARTDDRPGALAMHLLTGEPLGPAPAAMTKRNFVEVAPALIDRYAGNYRLADGRLLRVARRGQSLVADVAGEGPTDYLALGPREFTPRADEEILQFDVTAAGGVTGLTRYPSGKRGSKMTAARIDAGALSTNGITEE